MLKPAPLLTANHLLGVLNITYTSARGTAFLWGDERGSFLVTAKHVVANANSGDRIGIIQGPSSAHYCTIREVLFGPAGVDVAVMSFVDFSADTPHYASSKSGALLGQDVLFLGYPHGLSSTYPNEMGLPSPLVRKASFSGALHHDGVTITLLDGFNNPGYSGGPVWALDHTGDDTPQLLGIISGYRYETEEHGRVYQRLQDGSENPIPNTFVKPNSGMIYAVPADYMLMLARELKTRNPSVPSGFVPPVPKDPTPGWEGREQD